MKGAKILRDIEKGKAEVGDLTKKVLKDPTLVPVLLDGVKSSKARVRFGSAKVLRRLSETNPELLLPHWDRFVTRLSDGNTFLKSDAMYVLANLAVIDSEERFEKVFDRFYSHLDDRSMIPAANVAGVSGRLALAKPHLQTKIVKILTGIDGTSHGSECKNVIKGAVIDSFGEFYEEASVANKKRMLAFVRGELKNRRRSTRRKAERFVSRHVRPR